MDADRPKNLGGRVMRAPLRSKKMMRKAIIDGVIFALMTGVAIAFSARYGTLLIWSGVAIAMVGGMSAVGSQNVQGEYNLTFDQKIPQPNYHRTDEKLREMDRSYSFGVLMAAAGAVLIVVELFVNKIFTGEI